MILGPVLAIRKFLSYFYVVFLVVLNVKITKTLLTLLLCFGFVNLRAVGV
jgi:hypothetical protein